LHKGSETVTNIDNESEEKLPTPISLKMQPVTEEKSKEDIIQADINKTRLEKKKDELIKI